MTASAVRIARNAVSHTKRHCEGCQRWATFNVQQGGCRIYSSLIEQTLHGSEQNGDKVQEQGQRQGCFHLISKKHPVMSEASMQKSKGPMARYFELVSKRILREDSYQQKIIRLLQSLYDELENYSPPKLEPILPQSKSRKCLNFSRNFFGSIFNTSNECSPYYAPKGLYLYGDVGTGKTMVMDLFHASVPEHLKPYRRRIHFNAFMIDVHKRIHRLKMDHGHGLDPMPPLIRELAREASILCFDEFQVTDIADAMLLYRLIQGLLSSGVCIVTTSNRHPTDLYKNGIQRESFLPCIALLQEKLVVQSLDSGTDYRKIETSNGIPNSESSNHSTSLYIPDQPYLYPINKNTKTQLEDIWANLIQGQHVHDDKPLKIWGRELIIPQATWNTDPLASIARFTFFQLCGSPLSAADYIALTQRFGTVVLTDVPEMDLMQRDFARRLITLIDSCYEQGTHLVMTSEVPPPRIFIPSSGTTNVDHFDAYSNNSKVSLNTGSVNDEEMFAFHRAVSRMVQMGRKTWWLRGTEYTT